MLFNYFYLASNQLQQHNDDATMQRHNNNLTMQYACGTNNVLEHRVSIQRVEQWLLKSTCGASTSKSTCRA